MFSPSAHVCDEHAAPLMLTMNRASSASLPSVTLNPADSSSRQPPAFHHASLRQALSKGYESVPE